MKRQLGIVMAVVAMAMSACTGSRMATAGQEVDDVYYNKADRQADAKVAAEARAQAETAASYQPADEQPEDQPYTSYEDGYAAKNGETEGYYADDQGYYADDDYYYSRQIRRFNSNSWGYYSPYYSYDPYFAIGSPSWSYYNNSPWWYDPYYYNGPSYAWTYGWGAPGYYFYPSQYSYYGWSMGYGCSPYSNFGYGGFYGGGYYGNYFGGYGGYGYANGYYGAPGYYGGGTYFGNGGSTASNIAIGPRSNSSSLNTSGRPGNQPVFAPRPVRPTTSRPVKDLNLQSSQPTENTVRTTGRPGYNSPTYNTQPSTGRPTYNNGGTRPVQDNGVQSRPTPTPSEGTGRPTYNNGGSRPVQNNNGGGSISRPRQETYSAPRPSYESAPSRPTYSAPSSPSSPSPSRSTSPSGGGRGSR